MVKQIVIAAMVFGIALVYAGQYRNAYSGYWESTDGSGKTIQNFDILISLQRSGPISDQDKSNYNSIINDWADGIYELSNGGNRLANVRIVSNGVMTNDADVQWGRCGRGAWATALGAFLTGGSIFWFDYGACINTDSNSFQDPSLAPDYGYDNLQSSKFMDAAGTLTHESMHYFYGLHDEYSSADLGLGIYQGFGITESVSSNNVIFRVNLNDATSPAENWKKLKSYASAYAKGVPFFFKGNPPSPAVAATYCSTSTSDWNYNFECEANHYYAGDVVYNEKDMSVTIPVLDHQGNRVVFTDQGTGNWYIGWGDSFWSVPFSVASDQSGVGVAGTARYQRWNFGTDANGSPHSFQGRFFRRADGTSCSQWDAVTGNCAYNPSTMISKPVSAFIPSLAGRAPTDADTYLATDDRCAEYLDYLKYDEQKLLGIGAASPDYDFIDHYRLCRQIGPMRTYTVPKVKVELDQPGAQDEARKYLNIQWMDGIQTEVQFVFDNSGSMATNQKMKNALNVAKLVNWSHSLSGLSNLGITYFSPEFIKDVEQKTLQTRNGLSSSQLKATFGVIQSLSFMSSLAGGTATPLYDGLFQALSNFTSNTSSEKILYVMTDGRDNTSSHTFDEVVSLYKSKGVKIHVFAFGNDADLAMLSKLAQQTGGDYRRDISVSSGAPKAAGIAMSYVASNHGYSSTPTFTINQGESKQVNVGSSDRKLAFTAFGYGVSASSLVIKDPSGNVVIPSADLMDANTICFTVDSTQLVGKSGDWAVVGNQASSLTVQTLRWNAGFATEQMSLQLSPGNQVAYPNPLFITARLSSGSSLTGLRVQGYIVTPTLDTVPITLNDDGKDGDAQANDGVYSYRYTRYADSGHYSVTVNMDNSRGGARTTYVGTSRMTGASFGDTIHRAFEYSMSRGFDVIDFATDDHPAPPAAIDTLKVNSLAQAGRIDYATDEDWFLVSGLDLYSNLYLSVEAADSDAQLFVTGVNPTNVLDSFSLAKGLNEIEIPAWKQSVGMKLYMRGVVGLTYSLSAFLKPAGNLEVGGFEIGSGWGASSGSILDTTNPYSGKASLHTTEWGWREVRSRPVQTSEISRVSGQLSLKVYVPKVPLNPWWIGTVGLRVEIPSSNKSFDLGSQNLAGLAFGLYNSVSFPVPEALLASLAEQHPDVHFVVIMNGEPGIYVDQLEFTGKTAANVVSASRVVCPEPGCNVTTAISLLESSGSRRVTAMGDLWMNLQGHPTDWAPAHLHFGMSSEDGQPLTGALVIDGVTTVLQSWYQQVDLSYSSPHVVPIKLTNYSGRPYRLNWWFD